MIYQHFIDTPLLCLQFFMVGAGTLGLAHRLRSDQGVRQLWYVISVACRLRTAWTFLFLH